MRACLTGNAALPLVAGISCFAFVCSRFWVLKSRTRLRPMEVGIDIDTEAEKRKDRIGLLLVDGIDIDTEAEKREDRISQLPDDGIAIDTEAEKREDRISQLPDDVITLIILRLYTRDAVRTSVLSRRWRHVYTFITEVRFHCLLMPETQSLGDHEGGKLSQSQMKFVEGVDTFLRHYSGSKMKSFKFTCCFAGCFLDIFRKWMNSIARLGVEQLIIEIICGSHMLSSNPPVFASDFLPEESPVKRLCLWDSSFHTANHNALKILELNQVAFTAEEVERILSNCSSLQSLKLKYCMLPSKLRIHGPDLQLKSLTMNRCSNVKEIDLSAVNLTTFEIYHLSVLKLSFSYVPLLQNLFIEFHACEVTHVFGEVAENLPHLKCMFFKTYATCFEGYKMATVMNKLSNLRHLVLMELILILKQRRGKTELGIDIDTEAEKREDRISQLPDDGIAIDTEAEKREDRISQLPDDVIILIISRLYTRDAVRTSVRSRRWRHVYTFITEVRFHCLLMPETHSLGDHEGGKLSQSQMKFVEGMDTFLRRYSGSKMKSFKFTCCFAGCFLDIFRKWMNSIARLGVEQLIIEIICGSHKPFSNPPVFSSDFLPEASPVKRLCLWDSSFHTPNHNALKILELNQVDFTAEEVECILSNCSSLQSLKLKYCMLPSKLRIHGPDLQLKSLTMNRCSNVKEIDLSAVNLTTFEICHLNVLKLSFSYVPLLQNLFIEFHACEVTHVFGEVAENLPHLKCMFFKTYATCFEGYKMARVMNKLSNLRHLVLMLVSYNTLDLLSLAVILDVCPLLEKFHLSMIVSSMFNGKRAEKRVATCETRLKEVEFSGFSGTENEYNFILYILKNVVSLKQLSIFLNARHYKLHLGHWAAVGILKIDEKKHQTIRKRLQGQAISKNVDIIVTA